MKSTSSKNGKWFLPDKESARALRESLKAHSSLTSARDSGTIEQSGSARYPRAGEGCADEGVGAIPSGEKRPLDAGLRDDFAAAAKHLRVRMVTETADEEIEELADLIARAGGVTDGIPMPQRVDFVVNVRLILESRRLELVEGASKRVVSLTIKNDRVCLSGGGTTLGLDEVELVVRRKAAPSFRKRPSQARRQLGGVSDESVAP
ncbi:hypothetical protein Pla86_52950 (plasmid) [Planctomycetes bacterium Pla86]|uniref:Uncharacterized protein n=1 Tax=Engelhardtia mirabilis TaxID=2528011 RepID=A0A518BT75_9BACT|nr:hypothetical protein Pla133_52950 [Planctomycetes bacterium Pla133]QDV04499.1 hypothetical protein Pla86_52950 [Planctomycetes bacterium Pla86]